MVETQEEAMDRPDRDSRSRGSIGRDIEQGAVGAAEEHAGAHYPAEKLEAPPGPDSHRGPPRRSTLALASSPRRWLGEAIAELDPASTNVACHGRRARTSRPGDADFGPRS